MNRASLRGPPQRVNLVRAAIGGNAFRSSPSAIGACSSLLIVGSAVSFACLLARFRISRLNIIYAQNPVLDTVPDISNMAQMCAKTNIEDDDPTADSWFSCLKNRLSCLINRRQKQPRCLVQLYCNDSAFVGILPPRPLLGSDVVAHRSGPQSAGCGGRPPRMVSTTRRPF